jgi:hypothetical protein
LMPGVPCRPHDSAAGRRGDRWVVVQDKGKPDAPMLEGEFWRAQRQDACDNNT